MPGRRVTRRVLIAIASASVLIGCISRPPPERFVGILDELQPPPTWVLAQQAVRAPGSTYINCDFLVNNDCPSVHRFYVLDGPLNVAFFEAKAMLVHAGFTITDQVRPACDDSSDGIVACWLEGTRNLDRVLAILSLPGVDREEMGIAQPGKSIVELRAYPIPEPRSTG
jgi:hypothetical protein